MTQLAAHHFSVPSEIGYPVCLICGEGLSISLRPFVDHAVRVHSASHALAVSLHSEIVSSFDRTMERPLQVYYLSTRRPKSRLTLPHIPELSTFDLTGCPECPYAAETKDAIRRHISRYHPTCKQKIHSKSSSLEWETFRGQCFWKRSGWRHYWAIPNESEAAVENDMLDGQVPNSLNRDMKAALHGYANNSEHAGEVCNIYEKPQFQRITGFEGTLGRLGITWEQAWNLVGGPTVTDDSIDENVTCFVSLAVNTFMQLGRAALESDSIMLSSDPVRRAVAVPGITSKTKQFYLRLVETERRYAREATRVLLMLLRVWVNHRLETGNQAIPPIDSELDDIITEFVHCIPEEFDPDSVIVDHKLFDKEWVKTVGVASCDQEHDGQPNPCSTEKLKTCHSLHESDETETQCETASGEINLNGRCGNTLTGDESDDEGLALRTMKLTHQMFKKFFYEKQEIEIGSCPTLANLFITCLGVSRTPHNQFRLSLGREVSPSLAALGYVASVTALISIWLWPSCGSREKEIDEVSELHRPDGRRGLHAIQEVLAKTRICRTSEERRTWWMPCRDSKHVNCGISHGIHLSTTEVGKCIRDMQWSIFQKIVSSNGLFRPHDITKDVLEAISNCVESSASEEPGYQFTMDPRNKGVMERCGNIIHGTIDRITGTQKIFQRRTDLKALMRKCHEISSLLQCCLVLVGGMPGRGRETAAQTICNTHAHGLRSIFLYGGSVVMIPPYSKGDWTSKKKYGIVARFADCTSTFLFKMFMVLVVPVKRALHVGIEIVEGWRSGKKVINEDAIDHHIISCQASRSQAACVIKEQWSKFGIAMNLPQYPQWCAGYIRENYSGNLSEAARLARGLHVEDTIIENNGIDEDGEIENVMHEQMSHTVRVANQYYGQSASMTNIQQFSNLKSNDIRSFEIASREWHTVLNIFAPASFAQVLGRKFSEDDVGSPLTPKKRTCPSKEEDEESIGITPTARKVSRQITFPDDRIADPDAKDLFGEKNNDYGNIPHDLSMVADADVNRNRQPDADAEETEVQKNHNQPITMQTDGEGTDAVCNEHNNNRCDVDHYLHQLRLGCGKTEASFKSKEQMEALKAVGKKTNDILYIDRTGGGKSAVVLGPCMFEQSIMIYFVPLVALRCNLKARMEKLGVRCFLLHDFDKYNGVTRGPFAILCSPEDVHCRLSLYEKVVRTLSSMNALSRIVVDEAHLTVLASNYRQTMLSMKRIRPLHVDVPIVMLTATAPHFLQSTIIHSHGCSTSGTLKIVGDLSRDDLQIETRTIEDGKQETIIMEMCKVVCATLHVRRKTKFKAVVTFLNRAICDAAFISLNEKMNDDSTRVVKFHSGMDDSDRTATLNAWNDHESDEVGGVLVVFCTEGFCTGVDSQFVRLVVVVGGCRSLVEFWQTAGRCGRDGKGGTVIVLFCKAHIDHAGVEEVIARKMLCDAKNFFSNPKKCQRVTLDEYLGGVSLQLKCLDRPLRPSPCVSCQISGNSEYEEKEISEKHKEVNATPEDAHVEDEVGCTIFWAEELKRDVVGLLRRIAEAVNEKCIPCILGMNNEDFVVEHDLSCRNGRCLTCASTEHSWSECPYEKSGGFRMKGCRACHLHVVCGRVIHNGRGTSLNEYGSIDRCPYRKLMSFAYAIWNDEQLVKDMIQKKVFDGMDSTPVNIEEYLQWLVSEKVDMVNGIVRFAIYVSKKFDNHLCN